MKKIINLLKTIHDMVQCGYKMELLVIPIIWLVLFLIFFGLFVAILAFPCIPNEIYEINVLKFIKLSGIVIVGILVIACLCNLVSSIKDAIMIIEDFQSWK